MWIEELKEVFEEFRKYKNEKINPELNNLKEVLFDWVDYIIASHSEHSKILVKTEGFDLLNFKAMLTKAIKPWLEDKAPYEDKNMNGNWEPQFKPYLKCKGDEFYKIALQFFDWIIIVCAKITELEKKND